ncbi:Transmembrane protein 110, partial [Merops nubicus]
RRFGNEQEEGDPCSLFLHTSKQAIGPFLIHFTNIYLSDLTGDPCSLYLISFFLDATL